MSFSRPCPVCSADVGDVYRHLAWHISEGHDVSQQRQDEVTEAGAAALAEAQRQWEAVHDTP